MTPFDTTQLCHDGIGVAGMHRFLKISDGINDKWLDEVHFAEICKKNSALLYQCVQLQYKLREHVGGHRFWRGVEGRRDMMFGPSFIGVDVILKYNGDAAAMRRHFEKQDEIRAL